MTNPVIISPTGNTRLVSGRGPNRTVGRNRPVNVPASVEPFFTDDFTNGQVNPSNGVTYSNTEGGLKRTSVVAASGEGLADTDGASWLLKTTYLPYTELSPNGQVNMSLGRDCNELWVEWRYFCPSNYAHRNDPSVDNNKWVMAWNEPYSSGTHQVACELERGTLPVHSIIRPLMRFSANQNGATAGVYTRIQAGISDPIIGGTGPITPGTWNTIRWYTRKASALGTADGIWRLWVNGVVLKQFTGLHMGSNDPLKFTGGLNAVYFFGTANSGYEETTTFYTRRITFYDSDPGWV